MRLDDTVSAAVVLAVSLGLPVALFVGLWLERLPWRRRERSESSNPLKGLYADSLYTVAITLCIVSTVTGVMCPSDIGSGMMPFPAALAWSLAGSFVATAMLGIVTAFKRDLFFRRPLCLTTWRKRLHLHLPGVSLNLALGGRVMIPLSWVRNLLNVSAMMAIMAYTFLILYQFVAIIDAWLRGTTNA